MTELIQISLIITNNLPQPMVVPVMAGVAQNSQDCFAKNYFTWDLSLETFIGLTQLQLLYQLPTGGGFLDKTVAFSGTTVNEVASVLNTFGLTAFYVSGSTIHAFTDNYILDDLNLT